MAKTIASKSKAPAKPQPRATPTPQPSAKPQFPPNPQSPPPPQSPSNALGSGQSLATFQINELAQYTKEKAYDSSASTMFHLFYVGRDDVHDILKYVLSRVTVSLYLNMYSYDDQELNDIIFAKALDPSVTMLITLDESQSGNKTETALLNSDIGKNPNAYNTHFVVGKSSTGQISHTKGFVADGKVAGEGSTNWSRSGEGVFVVTGQAGGSGYKAQNNTQSIILDPDTVSRFSAELIAEHMAAQALANPPQKKSQQPNKP
jgi:hypothetical protein